MAHKTVHMKL